MFAITAILEDIQIVAQRSESLIEGTLKGLWHITLCDGHSGESKDVDWTDEQFSAVMALAINGDSGSESEKLLYPIAEKACEGIGQEIRPIP